MSGSNFWKLPQFVDKSFAQILHGELEASLLATQAQLAEAESELEKQRELNERLENDLLQMDRHKPNGHSSGRDTPIDSSADVLASLDIGKRDSQARTSPIPFASSADTSILPIVTSQRDRFRQRNAELEEVRINSGFYETWVLMTYPHIGASQTVQYYL